MTVIGVSGDVRIDSLDTQPTPAYYFLQSWLPLHRQRQQLARHRDLRPHER